MQKLLLLPLLCLLISTSCDRVNRSTVPESGDGAAAASEERDMAYPAPAMPPVREEALYAEEALYETEQKEMIVSSSAGGAAARVSVSQPQAAAYDTVAKQIIKTANLTYEVKQLQQANQKVDSLVKRLGGYISSSNQNNNRERHQLDLALRVPSHHFDVLLKGLSSLPERIDHQSVHAEDVTEQYVDLKSRLQTKKKVEKRYQELLQKANTVKEILEVEEKLRQLQEEIEAKEGQLRYLSHQVGYSTVHLSLYEVQKFEYLPAKSPHFGQRLLGALDSGWQLLLSILLGIFYLWPLWVFGALVWVGIKKWRRSRSAAHTAEK